MRISLPIISAMVLALLLFGCAGTADNQNAVASVHASVQASIQGGDNAMTAQNGDTVSVDYVGTLDNGTVFDSGSLNFTVGGGQMISGFDAAVVGMKVGEEKNVHLTPAEAYGEKRADAIISVPIENVPAGVKVGSQLSTSSGAAGIVIEVNATSVKIDFNSPMAGKALNFKIIMRKITKK